MQNHKLALVLAAILVSPIASAEINFRTDQPVNFYNGIDMNDYPIQNLGAPQSNVDAVRMQELSQMLNRTNGTLAGNIDFNGNNAELRGGYISNDGDDEGIRVLDSGEVKIENGFLNLSGNSLTGLPVSDNSNDAVRQDQLSNYVKLNGDTLDGNLSFNNQYYIRGLQDPVNSQDAATKSYVESYSDTNDNVISDDQDLSIVTDSSNGGPITIDIDNGSSVTFTDEYAADDQNLGTSGNQITLDNGSSVTAPYAENADQLDGVQLGSIDWSDTAMNTSDVSKDDVELGNVENIAQSSLAGDQLSWDSTNNELDLSGSLYGDEDAQDAAWSIASGGGNVDVSYDDEGNSVTIGLSGSLYGDEDAQDAVGNIITGSGATSVTYDDSGNSIQISSTDNVEDDQPLSETLTDGNTADQNIDMNAELNAADGKIIVPTGTDAGL
jgi:hypothetical protein